MFKRTEKNKQISHLMHIFQHITWEHIFWTKITVIGLTGLKLLVSSTLATGILITGIVFNPLTTQNVASEELTQVEPSQLGLCGNGVVEFGEQCDGQVSCELPCECDQNFEICEYSCQPVTADCPADKNDSVTEETDKTASCTPGEERLCTTGRGGHCQGGSQTCIDGQRSDCHPLHTIPERCDDEIDNDCDTYIDGADEDCQATPTTGCTDERACNYDPKATEDDGSCMLPVGCNDRCPGDEGSPLRINSCGICGGDESACENQKDCAGVDNGRHIIDKCGQCLKPSDSEFNGCATLPQGDSFTARTQTVRPQETATCEQCAKDIDLIYKDISAAQDSLYQTCRASQSVTSCLQQLGVELTETSITLFQRLRCKIVGTSQEIDCKEYESDESLPAEQESTFTTQTAASNTQQELPSEKEQQRELFKLCVAKEEHPQQDCAHILYKNPFSSRQ